ncbi:MAG: TPM domain-containing protein [Pseudomonadota bacterium]
MTLLTDHEAQAVADAITQIERDTDAELVTVIARQADEYYYIPTLWAALGALLVPAITMFTPFWLDSVDVLIAQILAFGCLALLFRIPALLRHLIPANVKRQRAAHLARSMFLENNLHHTQGETGVLIFISELEHYVEILADRGINDAVAEGVWDQIVQDFVLSLKQGNRQAAIDTMVNNCGTLLKQHVPATHSKNELPNHLILL